MAVANKPSVGIPSLMAALLKLGTVMQVRAKSAMYALVSIASHAHSSGVWVMVTVSTATRPSTADMPGTDILSAWFTPSTDAERISLIGRHV